MDRTATGRLAKDDASFRAPRSRAALRCRAKRRLMEIVRRVVPDAASGLAAAGVHPVLARIYAARGVATADDLATDLARLPSFSLLKGIDQAAARLAAAAPPPTPSPPIPPASRHSRYSRASIKPPPASPMPSRARSESW